MDNFAIPVKRGCGKRAQGGVYSECGTSSVGRPVETFLMCPPVKVNEKDLGLSAIGVKIINGNVWDWIGSQYYPNVTDFIEEVRRFGMSRRLPKTLDFASLNLEPQQILLHSRAYIEEPPPHSENRIGGDTMGYDWQFCPLDKHHNLKGETGPCAGMWWEDLIPSTITKTEGRIGNRTMPSFSFTGAEAPKKKAERSLAVFASFPIKRLVVVKADDGSHEETFEKICKKTKLQVEVVDE